MRKVNFKEAKEIMDTRPQWILLDVREEEEFITGHAEDALLLPVDEIDENRAADVIPSKDTVVLVYCRSGRRSADAAKKLESYGYGEIYDIGSLIGWPYGME